MEGVREKNKWNVTLADQSTGQQFEEPVEAYWAADHDGTEEAVGHAGRLQANKRLGNVFAVLKVELVGRAPATP